MGTLQSSSKVLVNETLPYDQSFHLRDGLGFEKTLSSLYELIQFSPEISPETFNYHVNKEKNDFSEWIKYVIQDVKLANEIKKVKSLKTFVKKLQDLEAKKK